VDPIGMVLKGYVTPLLAANGFTKIGATYRLAGRNGDQVLIEARRESGSSAEEGRFFVNLAAVPHPRWEFMRFCYPKQRLGQPGVVDGVLGLRLRTDVNEVGYWYDPRPESWSRAWRPGSGPRPRWSSDEWLVRGAEGVAICGPVLAAALRDEALPLLLSLLDRQVFLARIRDQASSFPQGTRVAAWTELFLLIDDGPSDELEAQIARVEAWEAEHPDRPHSLVTWARQRLAARARDEDRRTEPEE
jgi:hypothetical protein